MTIQPEDIQGFIEASLPCEHIEITGDGQHFFATIVSKLFEGKTLIQRHQMVYKALGDRMRADIHALSMTTMTPTEWHKAP